MPEQSALRTWQGAVSPEWVDYNGHMNEGFYGLVFAMASDEYLLRIGFDQRYRTSTGGTFYTVETHIVFIGELTEGQPLAVDTTVAGADPKRVHLFHELRALSERTDDDQETSDRQGTRDRRGTGGIAATQESMMLHVDTAVGRVAPMQADLHSALRADAETHAGLLPPGATGRAIRAVPT